MHINAFYMHYDHPGSIAADINAKKCAKNEKSMFGTLHHLKAASVKSCIDSLKSCSL